MGLLKLAATLLLVAGSSFAQSNRTSIQFRGPGGYRPPVQPGGAPPTPGGFSNYSSDYLNYDFNSALGETIRKMDLDWACGDYIFKNAVIHVWGKGGGQIVFSDGRDPIPLSYSSSTKTFHWYDEPEKAGQKRKVWFIEIPPVEENSRVLVGYYQGSTSVDYSGVHFKRYKTVVSNTFSQGDWVAARVGAEIKKRGEGVVSTVPGKEGQTWAQARILQVKDGWARLEQPDGTELVGWILLSELAKQNSFADSHKAK